MKNPHILPVSGDHFEDFLNLTDPDLKEQELPKAWKTLARQTQNHVAGGSSVDLNSIFIDAMRLQLLAYPIVEDWKRPLSNKEWRQIEGQSLELETQMERVRKLSIEVRKKTPNAFPEVASLFNSVFEQNQKLRKNWSQFKQNWTIYKQQWQRYQELQEEGAKKKKAFSGDSGTATRNKGTETESTPETPAPPQMFQRDQWLAMRISAGMMEQELKVRCGAILGNQAEPGQHPGIGYLVEELRKLYMETQGFELLEKVKLIQERNTQLIRELQPLFPEPIISAEMREQSQTPEKPGAADQDKTRKPAHPGALSKGLLLAGGIVLAGVLVVLMLHSPIVQKPKEEFKPLKFNPKGKTLTPRSSSDEPQQIELKDMMSGFNLGIPVIKPDEKLRQLISESPDKAKKLAHDMFKELGRDIGFAFAEANAYFLYWKGRLSRFASTREMREVMRGLEKQKRDLQKLLRDWSGEIPEDAKIIPETLNGEPVYTLEMLDENGEPIQVYMSGDGVRLRLSNGSFLEKEYRRDEALKRFRK